ncbi:aldo/keto reductase [Deinococcus alpinitundrae]|uniref:aldo/keto reductase n=1 Tax=Deinococcus alpinitundrae TaxID=468913 RepID=UPI0023532A26|nr:aldo/keto reductase [Deinococcus alpinitundrae]
MEETLEALNDLVRMGKMRYIGASTMYSWQFVKIVYTSRLRGWSEFVSMQCQLNAAYREEEREMIPFCPLARGLLSGAPQSLRNTTDHFNADQSGDQISFDIAAAVGRHLQPGGPELGHEPPRRDEYTGGRGNGGAARRADRRPRPSAHPRRGT